MTRVKALQLEMKKLSNPAKAKTLQRFFKTQKGQYGEGDKFLGIVVPEQRKIAKQYGDLTLKDLGVLIKSQWHEERLTALFILVEQFEKGDSALKKKIFDFYLSNTKYINNWDLVDLSAPNIVGLYLLDKKRDVLYKLAKSKSLWERRIAMLATFTFIKNKETRDALAISESLLGDKQDLMHKAVGWMLREIGKRASENDLYNFLDKNISHMPRTMLRYAIERLPQAKKQYYLGWGKAKICHKN